MKKIATLFMGVVLGTASVQAQISLPYSEDFSSAMSPSLPVGYMTQTIGTDAGFTTSNTSPGGFYLMTPLNGNYAITNDDACNCDKSADYLTLPGYFDLTTGVYFLSFAYELNDAYDGIADVQISLDSGSSWSVLGNLPATSTVDGTWTWSVISFDLASYATEDTVMFRFAYDDEGSFGFGLAVDEISITNPPAIEFGISSVSTNNQYYSIPKGQIRNIGVSFNYENNGLDTLTNVIVVATEPLSSYRDSVVIDTVFPGTTGMMSFMDSIWANDGEAIYTVDVSSNYPGDSFNTLNNSNSIDIIVSDTLYSLAENVSFFYTDDLIYLNKYSIHQRDTLLSTWVTLYNGSNQPLVDGDVFYGVLYLLGTDGNPLFELSFSDTITIADQANLGTYPTFKLTYPENLNLEKGEYGMAVVAANDINMLGEVSDNYVATGGLIGDDSTDPITWTSTEDFYSGGTYWFIDAVLSSNRYPTLIPDEPLIPIDVNIKEVTLNTISLYPNPAKDVVIIDGVSNANSIVISDITGKVVKNITSNNNSSVAVNTSDLTSGVYFVSVETADSKEVKKLIIK